MSVNTFPPSLSVAVVGDLDAGKSTVVGHLRYLCGCVPQRELDKIDELATERGMTSFKFAWLNDKRQSERERGVTIEVTETQLLTPKYTLGMVDTPGHASFRKQAVMGAAVTDHAVLVVDAREGAYEASMSDNGATKEHALVAFAMGAKQIIVLVNKMDALSTPFALARFDEIANDVGEYLGKLGFQNDSVQFVPVSGYEGDNLVTRSVRMPWYGGATLLEAFDNLTPPMRAVDKPLRLPVGDVYHVAGIGLVVTGCVQTGVLKRGMQLSFGLHGKKGTVYSIESNHRTVTEATPGMAVGINIKGLTRNDVKRGDVASDIMCDEARTAAQFTAQLVFLRHPGMPEVKVGYSPVVHCHTTHTACIIKEITAKLDRRTGEVLEKTSAAQPLTAQWGDACTVVMEPSKRMVVEAFREYPTLGRIVVRDANTTIAVGVIQSVRKNGTWTP